MFIFLFGLCVGLVLGYWLAIMRNSDMGDW
jgi:hypothetical protein